MAYSLAAQVRAYGPQIPASLDVAAYITDADGIIDSTLRGIFTVPLVTDGEATTDQIIATISAKLAAGFCLNAYNSTHSNDPLKYADDLIAWAMKKLEAITASPDLVTCDLVEDSVDDEERDGVIIGGGADLPKFTMDEPEAW